MGFFIDDDKVPQALKPVRAKAPAPGRATPRTGGKGCDNCGLRALWGRISTARMAFSGNVKTGDILILGDNPSEQDDYEGHPFADEAGKLLRQILPARERDRFVFGNLTRCSAKGAPTQDDDAHACSVHLEDDIAKLPIKLIIGLGPGPLRRFFPGMQIQDARGTRFPLNIGGKTVWYVACIDPQFVIEKTSKWGGVEGSYVWPLFTTDIKNTLRDFDKWHKPVVSSDIQPDLVFLPQTEAEAREMLAEMHGQKAIDIETHNDDPVKKSRNLRPYAVGSRILSSSIGCEEFSIAFPVDHPQGKTDWGLRLTIEIANAEPWTAHNIAFEYMWLKWYADKLGLPFDPPHIDCTQAAARIWHNGENILSLDDVTQAHLGIAIKSLSEVDVRNLLEFPIREVLKYNGLDTIPCARLLSLMLPTIDRRNYKRLIAAAITTADMALLGLPVDIEQAEILKKQWGGLVESATKQARNIYEVKAFERATGKEWNIASAQDVGQALATYGKISLPRTAKGGQFSTSDDDLKAAAGEEHPLVQAVLEFRTAAKLESTYIDAMLNTVKRFGEPILHFNYTTTLTSTLRLSSEDPNGQNWPKRQYPELRRPVVAPPGHVLVKFDYKALEARMFGMVTKDANLCKFIITGYDIHSHWRDEALRIHPDYINRLAIKTKKNELKEILKGGRDIIKTDFVFSSFFGSIAKSVAERTGMPLDVAIRLLEMFWQQFPEVKRWVKRRRDEYKQTGEIHTITGHVRRGLMAKGNEPLNTPIQGPSAQIVLDAMNELAALSRAEKDPYLHPRLQIHDDLTFILPDNSSLEGYIRTIADILVKVRYDWQIVPLAVEGAIGDNWAEMHEFCNYEGKYIR